MIYDCPFSVGKAVANTVYFVNRRHPLKRTASRLVRGESTALVGEPRTGKTSFLNYLMAVETRAKLYGADGERLLFSFVDAHTLDSQFTQGQFWERAFAPIQEVLLAPSLEHNLSQQYVLCQQNSFGTYTLELFFRSLRGSDRQLVLLLDEFDDYLHHPILNSAEFFGGLRALASRSDGALCLVIASRQPLHRLNELTLPFNPIGSPYFNIFSEVHLADFSEADSDELLCRAGARFSAQDHNYLRRLAGGHPFLLQAAAVEMWDAPPATPGLNGQVQRRRYVAEHLYDSHKQHFGDAWRNWSPEMRKAFTVVGLAAARQLLPQRQFDLDTLLDDLRNLGPELRSHTDSGLLMPDPTVAGGWRVRQYVMLWWLADELERAIRSESEFGAWLRSAELDGRWTKGQKQRISEAMQGAGGMARQLIEAVALGFGTGAGLSAG